MKKYTSWKAFAHDWAVAGKRKSMFPFCEPTKGGEEFCPVHGDPIGLISRMCITCSREAWKWTADEWSKRSHSQVDVR